MSNYVLGDGRLDWRIANIAYEFSVEVTGTNEYRHPERGRLEKGAGAVLKHVLRRLRNGETIPSKPTAMQAKHGISEGMVAELTSRLVSLLANHLDEIEGSMSRARETLEAARP